MNQMPAASNINSPLQSAGQIISKIMDTNGVKYSKPQQNCGLNQFSIN